MTTGFVHSARLLGALSFAALMVACEPTPSKPPPLDGGVVLPSCNNCAGPSEGPGEATCSNGVCGIACAEGHHLCGTRCVPDDDVSACGSACVQCPALENALQDVQRGRTVPRRGCMMLRLRCVIGSHVCA